MLEVFVDGFFQAQEELRRGGVADKPQEDEEQPDPRQPSMFD
jgi:hypothetical protein